MIVAALLAFLLNLVVLRGSDDRVTVTVAARTLEAGEPVHAEDLAVASVLVDDRVLATLVPGAERDGIVGLVLAHPLGEGELLTRSALVEPASRDGRRAMSVPIDPAHAVGGVLRPGDRIDVIEVADGRPRYIAVGIEVVDVSTGGSGTTIGVISSPHVTVVVDAETALRLAAAIRGEAIEVVRSTGADVPSVLELPEEPVGR